MTSAPPISIYQAARIRYRVDAILDGSAERDRAAEFDRQSREYREVPVRLAAERRAASMARLVADCNAKRKARAARTTSGDGWRVLDRPHEELEAFARNTWDLAFHGIPFPTGWRVRWADLGGLHALGVCVSSARLLLIDERAQRGRSPQDFLRTVVHELVHIQHPDENHGAGFEDTLARVLAYVIEPPHAVADSSPIRYKSFEEAVALATSLAPVSERPHPTPPTGARRRPGGFLDPTLEYRG